MFKVGEVVLYGTEGACEIVEIGKRDLGAGPREYYILRPVYRKEAVVFVPADVERLVSRMKRVLTAEEIDTIILEIPGEEFLWIENEAERKNRYRELLAEGDCRMLIRMIKSLYLHQKEQSTRGRKLHTADERAFKDAERLLFDQFALALQIQPDEVLPYIIKKIES